MKSVASGGGGDSPYISEADAGVYLATHADPPEPQKWVIVSVAVRADMSGSIDLRAEDGPWQGSTITLDDASPSMWRWCLDRIGQSVTQAEVASGAVSGDSLRELDRI